jgi:hypothetical protein
MVLALLLHVLGAAGMVMLVLTLRVGMAMLVFVTAAAAASVLALRAPVVIRNAGIFIRFLITTGLKMETVLCVMTIIGKCHNKQKRKKPLSIIL